MRTFCHKKQEIQRIWISTTEVGDVFTTSVIDLAIGVITNKNKKEQLLSGLMFIALLRKSVNSPYNGLMENVGYAMSDFFYSKFFPFYFSRLLIPNPC